MNRDTSLGQQRSRLLAELHDLVAQRDAVDRSSPLSGLALVRIAGLVISKNRELVTLACAPPTLATLEALRARAELDRALIDIGLEPDEAYISTNYPGWHRKAKAAPGTEPTATGVDPLIAITAVTDRLADLVETQSQAITTALRAAPAPIELTVHQPAPVVNNEITNVVQPATVDLSVTANIPPRTTITEIKRDARTGDIAQMVQIERAADVAP